MLRKEMGCGCTIGITHYMFVTSMLYTVHEKVKFLVVEVIKRMYQTTN